jgi:hypothetical protein
MSVLAASDPYPTRKVRVRKLAYKVPFFDEIYIGIPFLYIIII